MKQMSLHFLLSSRLFVCALLLALPLIGRAVDLVEVTQVPSSLQAHGVFTFAVSYETSEPRDLVISFYDPSDWSWVTGAYHRITVNGSGYASEVFEYSGLDAGRVYKLNAYLAPVGAWWEDRVADKWVDLSVDSESLQFRSVPTKTSPSYPIVTNVQYHVDQESEIVVALYDPTDWSWAGGPEVVTQVPAGEGSVQPVFFFNDEPDLIPGRTYRMKAEIRPLGGTWQDARTEIWQSIEVLREDEISFDEPPTTVSVAGEIYGLSVYYHASEKRDLVVGLYDPDNNWALVGTQVTTTVQGDGNAYVFGFEPPSLVAGKTYMWKAELRPTGGVWQDSLYDDYSAITVNGDVIYDAVETPYEIGVLANEYRIDVNGSTTGARDIVVALYDPENYTWASASEYRVTVDAGAFFSYVDVQVPAGLIPNKPYLWKMEIRPVGGGWQDALETVWQDAICVDDSISVEVPPAIVTIGDTISLNVDYNLSKEREISVYLGDESFPKNSGTVFLDRTRYEEGTGTLNFQISTLSRSALAHGNYVLRVKLRRVAVDNEGGRDYDLEIVEFPIDLVD